MIQIQKLNKSFADQILLEDADLQLGKSEKLGLIGRNGHGKSTLFKIILDEEHSNGGTIEIPKNYTMGHLSQHLKFEHPTILAEVESALPLHEGGWKETFKAEAMLGGLGFSPSDFERAPAEFSGGYQIRLNLAKLLLTEPDLLLLDEPTNYLDIVSVRWLERFLREWPREMILITHDREFMNKVCTHTAIIHRQKIKKCTGSTHDLLQQILEEEEQYSKTLDNEAAKKAELQKFIDRFKAKATKAKQAQSRQKLLDKMGSKENLDHIKSLEFTFKEAPFPAKRMIKCENLSFGYSADDLLFKDLNFEVFKGDVIGIVGPNGRGKSTLLNTLFGLLTPVSGNVILHDAVQSSIFAQTNAARLNPDKTVLQEIEAFLPPDEKIRARSVAGNMMFEGDSALKKIQVLSGGEKSRVMLGQILATPSNVLFLDEPTNHLDMESIDALAEAIEVFDGVTIIVSHTEAILERLCNRLVVFDAGECMVYDGGYAEFLAKIGWSKENNKTAPSSNAQESAVKESPKMDRAARAQFIQDRSKALKPIKQKIEKLEEQIGKWEEDEKATQNVLLAASEQGDGSKISSSAQELKVIQDNIENAFIELAEQMDLLDLKEKEWALEAE
jgi:ATP-binding cassette subfamily F protein 3